MQTVTELGTLHVARVGMEDFPTIRRLNRTVFGEARVINQLDRRNLLLFLAWLDGEPVGFKVGYGLSETTYYSAKGGVLEAHRGRGVARALLHAMEREARALGYARFAYDTFPNMHPGMTVLGLREGFEVTAAGYNATYQDYRIRFEKAL
ncbi:MAG: GNAT family N-acetyltransferase [Bacteroidota bacterium]